MPVLGGHRLNTTVSNAGVGSGGAGTGAGVSAAAAQAASASAFNIAPWLFPTSDSRDLNVYGSVALPAIGAGNKVRILLRKISAGRSALITGVGVDYNANGGAAFTPHVQPFELSFAVVLNGQAFPGDWALFNFLPGSVSSPDPVSGWKLRENDQIELWVWNNSIVVTTQWIGARIRGYQYSKNFDPASRGAQ